MKKLLVILMLGAGFVKVASADEPLDCTTKINNPCCIDVARIQSELCQAPTHVITIEEYSITYLSSTLVNNSKDGICQDPTTYLNNGVPHTENFQWLEGHLEGTFFPIP